MLSRTHDTGPSSTATQAIRLYSLSLSHLNLQKPPNGIRMQNMTLLKHALHYYQARGAAAPTAKTAPRPRRGPSRVGSP